VQDKAEPLKIAINIFGEQVLEDSGDRMVLNEDTGEFRIANEDIKLSLTEQLRFLIVNKVKPDPLALASITAVMLQQDKKESIQKVVFDGYELNDGANRIIALGADFGAANAFVMNDIVPSHISKDKQLESLKAAVTAHIESAWDDNGARWIRANWGENSLTEEVISTQATRDRLEPRNASEWIGSFKALYDEESEKLEQFVSRINPGAPYIPIHSYEAVLKAIVKEDVF
jgi:hypothetical protein